MQMTKHFYFLAVFPAKYPQKHAGTHKNIYLFE